MNDYTVRENEIRDRKDAIEFYAQRIEQFATCRENMVRLRNDLVDHCDNSIASEAEDDVLAKAYCKYLIKYLEDRITEDEGEIRYEQEELDKLIS